MAADERSVDELRARLTAALRECGSLKAQLDQLRQRPRVAHSPPPPAAAAAPTAFEAFSSDAAKRLRFELLQRDRQHVHDMHELAADVSNARRELSAEQARVAALQHAGAALVGRCARAGDFIVSLHASWQALLTGHALSEHAPARRLLSATLQIGEALVAASKKYTSGSSAEGASDGAVIPVAPHMRAERARSAVAAAAAAPRSGSASSATSAGSRRREGRNSVAAADKAAAPAATDDKVSTLVGVCEDLTRENATLRKRIAALTEEVQAGVAMQQRLQQQAAQLVKSDALASAAREHAKQLEAQLENERIHSAAQRAAFLRQQQQLLDAQVAADVAEERMHQARRMANLASLGTNHHDAAVTAPATQKHEPRRERVDELPQINVIESKSSRTPPPLQEEADSHAAEREKVLASPLRPSRGTSTASGVTRAPAPSSPSPAGSSLSPASAPAAARSARAFVARARAAVEVPRPALDPTTPVAHPMSAPRTKYDGDSPSTLTGTASTSASTMEFLQEVRDIAARGPLTPSLSPSHVRNMLDDALSGYTGSATREEASQPAQRPALARSRVHADLTAMDDEIADMRAAMAVLGHVRATAPRASAAPTRTADVAEVSPVSRLLRQVLRRDEDHDEGASGSNSADGDAGGGRMQPQPGTRGSGTRVPLGLKRGSSHSSTMDLDSISSLSGSSADD